MTKSSRGNFFEDFAVGQTIHHATPRTVTEGDAALYLALTGSRFPLYCSATMARMAGLRKDGLIHLGGALSPFAAYLILRGMETLPLRMERHETNARRVAEFLQGHPRVRRVLWPGLSTHPGHDIAARQMRNFSGLLSFSLKADSLPAARRLAEQGQDRTGPYGPDHGRSRRAFGMLGNTGAVAGGELVSQGAPSSGVASGGGPTRRPVGPVRAAFQGR